MSSGSAEATQTAIKNYTNDAYMVLEKLTISEDKKQQLRDFGHALMMRAV
jgi:geranylgeranyl diphosphate synthase type II